MIRRPTVFVLGAGASAPYGFPLGTALMTEVCSQLLYVRPPSRFCDDLLVDGVTVQRLQEFAEALIASGRYSIDEFLQWHPLYREIGKMAIARTLIPCEREDRLDFAADPAEWLKGGPDTRWYRYFFDKLLTSQRGACQISQNRLTIVTFNFDRSFEVAFVRFLLANCGSLQRPADLREMVRHIPVLHMHGQLVGRNWVPDDDMFPYLRLAETSDTFSYSPIDVSSERLKLCAAQIRIVDEEVTASSSFSYALDCLEQAEVVCFLGFSYHPLNLGKLKIEKLRGKKVYGTAYGLPQGPRNSIIRTFSAAGVEIELASTAVDILTFLQNTDLIYD